MHIRWFRNPCLRYRRLLCILVSVCVIAGCLIMGLLTWSVLDEMRCSETESIDLLHHYCYQYHLGLLVGDLCPALCDNKLITYRNCTNYPGGKHVFIMDCKNLCASGNSTRAVLKTKNQELVPDEDDFFDGFMQQISVENRTADALLSAMLISIMKSEFSNEMFTEDDSNIIMKLWNADYKQYLSNPTTLLAFAKSIIYLANQSEFRMLRMNQHLPYFPKIYGTCGPLYLVEYSPPSKKLGHHFPLMKGKQYSFTERAVVALQILDTLYRIEVDMLEPLHLCDVKGENFGMGDDGIKLIDVDTVFYDSMLKSIIGGQNCSSHQDCHFFDCRGFCDKATGTCQSFRTNSNFQSVCEDVFLGKWVNIIGGLLRDPPSSISDQLQSILYECAFKQTWENGTLIQKPSKDIIWKLYDLLLLSVNKAKTE